MNTHKQSTDLGSCIAFHIVDCLSRGQSDKTAYSKRILLTMFEKWCAKEGVTDVTKIDLELLEKYRRYLYRYRKAVDGQKLELCTQRMRLMAITDFLKRLRYHGVISSDEYLKFPLPKVPKKLPKEIPDEHDIEPILQQAMIKERVAVRNRAILEVYYATGIRRAELANLNIRDINLRYKVVTIRKGKGGADRKVPISDKALYWVKKYLKELRPKLACIDSGDALFLGETGKRIKLARLTEIVGECIRRSGIGKSGACHALRHAAATHMLMNGADIRYIQELLGHSSITSTEVYTHIAINDLMSVYQRTHPSMRKQ